MANKEKIDYLLLDIRELENSVAGMRDAEIYPASFFSETFQLTHKILKNLHSLEEHQIETLRRQMEEHQRLIASIPIQKVYHESECLQPIIPLEPEVIEEKVEVIEEKVIEPALPKEEAPIEVKAAIIEEVIANEEPVAVEQVVVKAEPIVKETPLIKEEPIHIPQPEKSYQTILSEKQGISFNEILERQNLSDFRKAFSLNDRFRFRRELFGGDEERMNKAITELNDIHSYEESVTYLNNVLQWNVEDVSVADFIKLLEKRFS